MSRGLILGTGPSLSKVAHLIPQFDGLIFGCNNTYQDFDLDVWLACDPAWHAHYGQVSGSFDAWHWSLEVCEKYGYKHVEGVWMDGLYMADKSKISLNHGSAPQIINLACNQYECETVVLLGHDFTYAEGQPRHYFDDLSDVAGEYPQPLRKYSKFIKNNGTDDLLAVYERIALTPGLPRVINCTPGSKLPWFEMGNLEDFLR